MGALWRDLRYAIRTLSSNPLLALTVVLPLGLAIGAATAVFSFTDAVLLRPFPYRDANRLVLLWASKTTQVTRGISGPDLADLRSQALLFEDVVPFVGSGVPLNFGVENSRTVRGFYVGGGLFSLLGVRPLVGRNFRPDEDHPGAEKAAVLSYSFWEDQFGGDRGIVGRGITLSGETYTVVGVTAPEFFFPDPTVQVWLPIAPAMLPRDRSAMSVHALARLKQGVTLARAQSDVDTIVRRLAAAYPDTDRSLSIGLFPLVDQIVGKHRAAFWSLLGGAGLLLLIGSANAGHLLLARGMRRRAEVSVRVALGATPGAIFRQLLTESLLLSVAAGATGVLVAFWGVRVLRGVGLTDIPRFAEARVDLAALTFALAISLLTGVSFGVLPALRASRANVVESLKEGGMAHSYGARSHLRDLLMVSEIAFAFVMMAAAGLLINSFVRLARVHWGFRPDHVLVADVLLPYAYAWDIPRETAFANQVIPGLKALPGVHSVSVAHGSPIAEVWGGGDALTLDGKQKVLVGRMELVGPGYFEALGIRLLSGRGFMESDNADAAKVAVVERGLAEQLWPGENPVGKRFFVPTVKSEVFHRVLMLHDSGRHAESRRLWDDPNSQEQIPYDVVGEVGPVLMYGPLQQETSAVYLDSRQRPACYPMMAQSFFLRTSTEPSGLAKAAREAIRAAGGGVTIMQIDTLERRVRRAVGARGSSKLLTVVSGVTSGLALALAALGIYGVMAFTTALRTHEIGVRIALGAQRGEIFRMVLGRGLLVTSAGLLFGMSGAIATTKMLASYLFGVSPTDPATFAAAIAVFLAVASLACYWPARWATKVDPMTALRYE
jgi:putative ABC transport system permease protein